MAIENNRLQLEKFAVSQFDKAWREGKFPGQRYGQAFYNHFRLERIVDQRQLKDLFNVPGESEGKALVKQVFKLN